MLNDFTPPTNPRILSIGAASLDIIGHIMTPPVLHASTPAHVRPSFGGVARNVAENLARLGQPTTLISVVGSDQLGQQLLDHTTACGVDTQLCLKSQTGTTAAYLAVLDVDNQLQFALDDMRILEELEAGYLKSHAAAFEDCGLVFLDANLSPTALQTALDLAHHARVPVCIDPTSPVLAAQIKPHLGRFELVTANIMEACVLCDQECEPQDLQGALILARTLISRGVRIAVVTLGAFGMCYASSETSGHVPAVETTVTDPTGAGNAMTAAILFGLINNIPLDETVRLGASAAALTLRYPGAVLPDLTLQKLYDQLVI